MNVDLNISSKLNNDEKELFSILLKVVEKYAPRVTLRIAGGWVRDHILGTPSDDIDVMIDYMAGQDFAKLVTQYLNIKDPNVIQANPEASKHITTAKCYIPLSSGKKQEVDFAQARQEIYKEDSRIPDIQPATPQQDAYKRDLTINSLFYNLRTGQIEDFTGKGIKDIITNTIQTPEDPLKTFSDDPLRIWRVVRFCAKYNGQIDPETYKALTNPKLRDEIKNKVSKERIGQEFIKILKNPNADKALQILKDTGLWEDIISEAIKGTPYEGQLAPLNMEQNNPWHTLTVWGHTLQVVINILSQYKNAEPERRIVMTLAALMHDLGKTYKKIWSDSKSHPGKTSYIGHEFESAKLVELIFKYLKIEPYIKEIALLSRLHMRPHSLLQQKAGDKGLRKFIRETGEISLNWLDVFNLAVADAQAKSTVQDPEITQRYQQLKSNLQNALQSFSTPQQDKPYTKPILNGNEITQILNIKPGPIIKEVIDYLKDLRDENPNITKEEATEKIKEKFSKTAKSFIITKIYT